MIRKSNVIHGLSTLFAPLALSSFVSAQDPAAAAAPAPTENWLVDMFQNAGTIGYLIVALSIVALALAIELFMSIKREKLAPPDVIDELEALFEEEQFQEAMDLCESNRNYLTNVVQAGLAKLGHQFETIQTAVKEMEEEETVKLFQRISWLSLITASAPMLGLLGTVSGMFVTFGEIARAGGSVQPSDLAGGIKIALVTTIFGLCVALPTGAFFFMFRNRVVRTTIEMNAIAEDLFERFRPKNT
ncbi:MAG: MotA/TolQ/ExbB proton channel family protein [Planctomycetes bacterium]|nr:MotA/TolQ/ExbB proton channel family protein [Planctomycetota bacterium]